MKKGKDNLEVKITFGDLIIGIALCFLWLPYKEGTLEVSGKEKLTFDFTYFDCSTFVETVLALAHCFVSGKITVRGFSKNLRFIRYRGGITAGYSSRLHYFTDWLRDNEKKKVIKDISKITGGKAKRKKINFMTSHRDMYPALKSKNEFQKMLVVEKNLSRRIFYIINKNKLSGNIQKIQNGDIVAFTANQDGLDVSHVGFAIWQGKNLYLIHASSKENAVVISKRTLTAYLKSSQKFSGVILARPL